ncbi:hypothetical protein FOZ62_009765, partial [Perkinsus olseni]
YRGYRRDSHRAALQGSYVVGCNRYGGLGHFLSPRSHTSARFYWGSPVAIPSAGPSSIGTLQLTMAKGDAIIDCPTPFEYSAGLQGLLVPTLTLSKARSTRIFSLHQGSRPAVGRVSSWPRSRSLRNSTSHRRHRQTLCSWLNTRPGKAAI